MLLVFFCHSAKTCIPEKPIAIVVPSWNNNELFEDVPRYQLNLDSIFNQKYSNYRVIYIDDCSSDGTATAVAHYVQKRGQNHRFILIKNAKRWGPSRNRYVGAHLAQDDEIVTYLDGDDWFSNDNVLNTVNQAYADPNVWLTYSHFIHAPDDGKTSGAQEIPQWVIEQNVYRTYGWYYHSLKTFYGWLFKQLRLEDILYEGTFFPVGSDIAEMFPLVELSGGRFKFIKDILYIASVHGSNEINVSGKNLLNQMWQVISSMPPYMPLKRKPLTIRPRAHAADFVVLAGTSTYKDINNTLTSIFAYVKDIQNIVLVINNSIDKIKVFNYLKSERKNFSRENIIIKNFSDFENNNFIKNLGHYIVCTDCRLLTHNLYMKQAIDALNTTYALLFYFGSDAQSLEQEKIPCLHIGLWDNASNKIHAFQFCRIKPQSIFLKNPAPFLCKKETLVNYFHSRHNKNSQQFAQDFSLWSVSQYRKIGLVYG